MKKKVLASVFFISIFFFQQLTAQINFNITHSCWNTIKYKIIYTLSGGSYSLPETTIDRLQNQTKTVPAGASNITISWKYLKFVEYSNYSNISANRSGGTLTFNGSIGNPVADWAPDDNVSGIGQEVAVDVNAVYPNGDAELHRTARSKQNIQMQTLIDKGTTLINKQNTRGFTPLHECIQSDFGDGIDILLRAGADAGIQNTAGETAFAMAIGLGKKELAQKFISNGYAAAGDVKALETAIKRRSEDMVKFMLDNGADAKTAVNLSIQQNNFQLVDMMMTNGLVNDISIDYFQKAVDARRFDIAKKMLDIGNLDANQTLDYAIAKNAPDLVQACMEKGGDAQKVLKYAIANRKPDMAAAAITNHGANANAVLDDAVKANQADLVSLMLDNQADPNLALTSALNNKKINLVPMIISKGAKVSNEQMIKVGATGDNALVKNLIDAGGDKNAALSGAMSAGKYQTAELIIQAGATPDNVVLTAVNNKQKNLLVAALDAGADANPGLAPAISNGLPDYAELLFKAGAKTNDVKLVAAVISKRDLNLLKLMLANQTDANLGMQAAVAANYPEAVQLLLSNNADAKASALIATAAKNKNQAMIDMLVKAGANPANGMQEAIKAGDVAITKYLIAAGANGNDIQLMNFSVAKNNAELTALFVDAGAAPGAAVETAIAQNAGNVLGMLIAKGADVKNPAYLIAAIKKNNLVTVSSLLNAGADVNYKDAQGNNLLHIAATAEADNVVSALATAGVKVNDINNAKDAPIHIAVTQGRGEVKLVEVFIAAGADVNMPNAVGKKPLDITKGSRIKNRLKEAGAAKTEN